MIRSAASSDRSILNDDVVDHGRLDRKPAVGEQLDDDVAEQFVVRLAEFHRPSGAQARERRRAAGSAAGHTRLVSSTGTPRSPARSRRWNSAASAIGPAWRSSTATAPAATIAGTALSSSAAAVVAAAPWQAARHSTRRLLPEPTGPARTPPAPASPASGRSGRSPRGWRPHKEVGAGHGGAVRQGEGEPPAAGGRTGHYARGGSSSSPGIGLAPIDRGRGG